MLHYIKCILQYRCDTCQMGLLVLTVNTAGEHTCTSACVPRSYIQECGCLHVCGMVMCNTL